MVHYKKKTRPILRYLLALVVFSLGLTLTVVDVYGLQLPFGQQAGDSYSNYLDKKVETTDDSARDTEIIINDTDSGQDDSTDTMPTSVPEPSTIILLASGLGLLRMAHRKK